VWRLPAAANVELVDARLGALHLRLSFLGTHTSQMPLGHPNTFDFDSAGGASAVRPVTGAAALLTLPRTRSARLVSRTHMFVAAVAASLD
jgi:hypothetical protein